MRIGIVGGGISGVLLAWRLAGGGHGRRSPHVELVLGENRYADATAASGGAVRGYEPDARQRELALASLRELLDSGRLRTWAGYRRTGSLYVHRPGTDLAGVLGEVDAVVPGSAELVPADRIAGWVGLPDGAVAVGEREAGHIQPDRLREAVLRDLVGRIRLGIGAVSAISVDGAGSVRCAVGGQRREYDVLVLATGGWTPALLRQSGLPHDGYRTKAIQYAVYKPTGRQLPAFFDETCGLYGIPTADGALQLGLPTDGWGVEPGRHPGTPWLHAEAARLAAIRFPRLRLGPVRRRVGAVDCYVQPPGLALRPVVASTDASSAGGRVFTFTGGSGGAAKTALAASAAAAAHLTGAVVHR